MGLMNNPFSRLKHFTPNENDPQENHATECLAACLVFSPRLRRAFIDFLSGGDGKLEIGDESEIDVATQREIEGGGYVDLVLDQPGKFTVAVEVKVKSPENCEHHRDQLKRYRTWLRAENQSNGYLFTLVRNPDRSFNPKQYGADERRSWSELFKRFRQMPKEANSTDIENNLVENFCEYLESEGIVSTYETKDLLRYSDGLKAKKAVTGIFNQVSSRLEIDRFQCEATDGGKNGWPQLKIEHPDWKKIFGKGKNQKVSILFTVPGIWGGDKHDFGFQIDLWNKEHGNDWRVAKPKLARWLETLKSREFDYDVDWKHTNVPANKIEFEPKSICASKNWGENILNQNSPQSEDELVNLLVERVKQLAGIVSSLEA
jgi:hypothetical protein